MVSSCYRLNSKGELYFAFSAVVGLASINPIACQWIGIQELISYATSINLEMSPDKGLTDLRKVCSISNEKFLFHAEDEYTKCKRQLLLDELILMEKAFE